MPLTMVNLVGNIQAEEPALPMGEIQIEFLLSGEMSDGVTTVYPEPITFNTDLNGHYDFDIPALTDPTTTPSGRYYEVKIMVPVGREVDHFQVVVPYNTVQPTSIYDLPLVNPVPGSSLVYGVSSFNGRSGAVQLTAQDVTDTGFSGSGGSGFVFNQAVALNTWTIPHNLGRKPSVTVHDSAGTRIGLFGVSYVDDNNLTCNFSAPFSGTAYLT